MRPEDTLKTELQNTTPQGTAPRRRLATPEAALSIYKKLLDADTNGGEAQRRAVIQGMIDGNPPYNPKELVEMGLGHLCNVNFMSMRSNLDERAGAAHELFVEVPTMIEARPRRAIATSPEIYHWCSIIAEEFTELLQDDEDFLTDMDLVARESDAYGIGPMLFPDEWDWRPKAYKRGNILFDPKASIKIDKNDLYVFRDEMSLSDLYDIAEDESSELRGWHVGNLRKLLVKTFITGNQSSQEDQFQRSTWESLQQMARNHDAEFQEKQFQKVQILHYLVREASGDRKVSHLIKPASESESYWLCEMYDQYEDMHNALWWLPYNYGDGYARSVRGVASLMVQHDDLSNRFLCRLFDSGFLASSLLVQPRTQPDLYKMQLMQHGPMTIIPPETSVIQSTFQPQIAPLVSLRNVGQQIMKNDTGQYRQHNEGLEREAAKTARQVVEEASKEARYEKAAVMHRYNVLDRLYREMFRRAVNKDYVNGDADYPGKEFAKKFIDNCAERGVEKSFIFDWAKNFKVSATRAIGLGSWGFRMDVTSQLLQASAMFDEFGKRMALRDWVAARVSYRAADKYVSFINRDEVPGNETSMSLLEWNDITEGHQTQVGSDQMHKLHIDVFLPRLAQIVQATETGQVQDPVTDLRTVSLAAEHVQAHMQYLAQDQRYVDYVKQLSQFLQALGQTASALQSMAKRVMQQEQAQQEDQENRVAQADKVLQDRELEAKVLEINRKYELEMAKQESLNAARAQKTQVQQNINTERMRSELQLKSERQAAEIALMQNKAAAESEAKRSS